ncbi:MAG: tetratricopeptide repeat protein, partial [Bacteroidota bacterium]
MKLDLPQASIKFTLLSVCLVSILFGCSPMHAQSYTNYKNAGKKTLKFYEKGKEALKAQSIEDAQRYFLQANKEDPTFIDSYIKMGDLYIDLNNYPAAIQSYEKAIALDPDYLTRLYYALGYMCYQLDHYDRAIPYLEKHLTLVKNGQRKINTENLLGHAKFALAAINNPVPFEPKRLSDAINTQFAEYLPSFTANGKQLVYTARRRGQEDLYFSEKINGEWTSGQAILGVNTNDNEGAQTMSADGRMIIFTACGRRDGFGSCDLFVSYKKEDYWTRPMNMGRTINSGAWDSQPSLSANGKFLFFASNRGGGKGKSDIYVAYYLGNGQWSDPQNLGDQINTAGDEKGPFFHADGRTLYFASSGHPGMGSLDLFKSNLMGDGIWSEPVNLGYPINSNGEEVTLIVSLDGKKAYFSSNRSNPNRGETDIFEFELY